MSTGTIVWSQAGGEGVKPYARRLLWARGIVVLAQTALLAAAIDQPGRPLVLWLMSGAIAVAALASMLGLQQLRRAGHVDDATMFRHVLADLAVLTYLLAVSGGPGNPFHDAFFLPVAVAAASLASRQAWMVAGASLVGYTIVQFVHVPLPGAEVASEGPLDAAEWLTHALLTALATHFLSHVRTHLRLRERQLAEVREAAARAECAVAVGSIAAGAAHELSTPITTIAAALETIRRKRADDPALMRDLDTIASGLRECRHALDVLRQARKQWNPSDPPLPLRDFVGELVNRFFNMHPGVPLTRQFDSRGAEPVINADLALQQAVINLLTNAAQASPDGVVLQVAWDDHELSFRVSDRGPGIPQDLLTKLGTGFFSGRPGGHGMGLFLTQVTAHRLGGSFRIGNGADGGAVAEIVLPLGLLQVNKDRHRS